MKTLATLATTLILAVSMAPLAHSATTGSGGEAGFEQIFGDVAPPQQSSSAPGCMRNPPPSQC